MKGGPPRLPCSTKANTAAATVATLGLTDASRLQARDNTQPMQILGARASRRLFNNTRRARILTLNIKLLSIIEPNPRNLSISRYTNSMPITAQLS